jgi:photosystem II stability/assembly factor-like uncharacterized protein
MTKIPNSAILIIFLLITFSGKTQNVKLLNSEQKVSFRGLSVADDQTIWVSGSNGTVGKSLDGGKTWRFQQIKGYEKTDFRDVEAFDSLNALIMGIDCPARILKTTDGGNFWKIVFEDTTKGMFLDAMSFNESNVSNGIVVGDPIEGKAFILSTSNKGDTWTKRELNRRPALDSGEAFFASSGSNICYYSKNDAVAVTGGKVSNLLFQQKKIPLPLIQGAESTGANAIAVKNATTFMIVGGDFTKKDATIGNFCFTKNAGKSWISSIQPPTGYRSCVAYIHENMWITCGLNGVDITEDDGLHFKRISNLGFHVCKKSKKGNKIFLAGGGGRIGIVELHQ